jgi:hypothetical protein
VTIVLADAATTADVGVIAGFDVGRVTDDGVYLPRYTRRGAAAVRPTPFTGLGDVELFVQTC